MVGLYNLMSRLERIRNNEQKGIFLSSGYEQMDEATEGFKKQTLYGISGLSELHRTKLIIQFIKNIINDKLQVHNVGIFSTNIPAELWLEKMVAEVSGINIELVQRGKMEEALYRLILDTNTLQCLLNITINDQPLLLLDEFKITAHHWVKEHNVEIIFIDNLEGLYKTRQNNSVFDEYEILKSLKSLAVELNIPMVFSVNISDKYEEPATHAVQIKSPKGLLKTADVLLHLMEREKEINECSFIGEEKTFFVKIAKNSNGHLTNFLIDM